MRFSTYASLLYTALALLGIEARLSCIKLRQSYVQIGKRAQMMARSNPHAKHYRRMRKQLKFLLNPAQVSGPRY